MKAKPTTAASLVHRPHHPAPERKPGRRTTLPNTAALTRILLVDDDSVVRDSLKDVLLSEGYLVTTAENGQQALDHVSRLSIDLVLLDLNMPVKNGWDTFEHLTREHPLTPIIIATARPNQLFTAIGAGVGALMEKPMDIPILLRTIGRLLAETSEQRLARLAGQGTEFHYQAAAAIPETRCSTRH